MMMSSTTNTEIPAIPYLASGDKFRMVNLASKKSESIKKRILNALAEYDFFEPLPNGVGGKEVYQTATKHIFEYINEPAQKITLAVHVNQGDVGTVADLLKLVPAFCKVVNPELNSEEWLQQGLDLYETKKEYKHDEWPDLTLELRCMPEIHYIMVIAEPKIKPQASNDDA